MQFINRFLIIRSKNVFPYHKIVQNFCSASAQKHVYSYNFYTDFKGLLYFDEGDPKNFILPNSIKDKKFIQFFYKNLIVIPKQQIRNDFQYVSEFWGQRNYLRCAIAPIIFNYIDFYEEEKDGKLGQLQYSFGQKCQFYPSKLRIDNQGRILHPYIKNADIKDKKNNAKSENNQQETIMGMFSTELMANTLENIKFSQQGKAFFYWKGKQYEITNL